jgi:tetratricopeptide (TPR) repeat protein
MASAQDHHARLDALRAEGYEALFNLDYETARSRFKKMIDLAPDHPAGAQCYASSLWVQQLNEAWKLKSTLYNDKSTDDKPRVDRKQAEEFRRWTRQAKQLSEARLRKDKQDVEALYFLGAAEGLEAAFAAGVERKFMPAFRSGTDAVDRHRAVLKLAPDFHDAELTIGLMNYVVGSLPLPAKMLAGTMGVRGSKKRGLEALERVAKEGKWARDIARMLLVDLYKREKRFADAAEMARQLAEKYPRNNLFKLQMTETRNQR